MSSTSKYRILVVPSATEIALEVGRSITMNKHVEAIGATSDQGFSPAVFPTVIPNVPTVYDRNFVPWIVELCLEHDIDMVYPAHDEAITVLSDVHDQVTVVGSPATTNRICRSKSATYACLADVVPVPVVLSGPEVLRAKYPLFVKPDRGQGSRGANIVTGPETASIYSNQEDLIFMEYLPGREYTVECFTDAKRDLIYCAGRERTRISNGISLSTAPCGDSRLIEMARAINSALEFRGAWFFQAREDVDGRVVLLEVSPRIPGSSVHSRSRGVNLPLLSIYDRAGITVVIPQANPMRPVVLGIERSLTSTVVIDELWDHLYVDMDDTLIVDGMANPVLVSLIYLSWNRNIPVTILTRHQGDPVAALDSVLLPRALFRDIIVIPRDREKWEYMSTRGLLVDDSFSERHMASRNGILAIDISEVPIFLDPIVR